MAIIKINGRDCPPVTAISLKLTDIMTDDSGRVAGGRARVKYVRCDVFGGDLEFPHITEKQLGELLTEIGTNNSSKKIFSVTYSVEGLEIVTDRTCYAGDRSIDLTSYANGEPRYTLKFSVAEV